MPLRDDKAAKDIGWQTTPDRKHRLRLFCETYDGLGPAQLLDAVDAYHEISITRMQTRGGAGEEPWAGFLKGYMSWLEDDIAWFAEHKASLC